MMRLAVVREGRALLYTPDSRQALTERGTLEPAWLEVFYNPAMTFNRDLSVVTANVFLRRNVSLVDAMAGTGVRGVRYSLEVTGVTYGVVNDLNPRALNIIKANIRLNGLQDVLSPANRDVNALLSSARRELGLRFDLVDVDPFGSPAPYIASALGALKVDGLLGVTATDLAVLGGSKPLAAVRRYWVGSLRPLRHYRETAIRVLLGYIARVAASQDLSIRPLMSISVDHYVRVFVTAEGGARRADEMLRNNMGCIETGPGGVIVMMKGCTGGDGPLWVGPLFDPQLVEAALASLDRLEHLETSGRLRWLLSTISEEAGLQFHFHQRLDHLCSAQRKNMPTLDEVRRYLTDIGYGFSRTHLSTVGFRTDAPPDVLSELCSRARS